MSISFPQHKLKFENFALFSVSLVAVLFFAGTLAPALGFINVYPMRYSFVADHFQYLACVGLIILCATVLSRVPPIILSVLLAGLGLLTWQQTHIYRNLETLWTDTIAKNPKGWMAHVDLSKVLVAQGRWPEAEAHYRVALGLRPDYEDLHFNFGNLLVNAGKIDEAIAHYEQALQLNPTDPDVHNNLGVALYFRKQTNEAIVHFRQALHERPVFTDARYNLGNALAAQSKGDEAVQQYLAALRLDPDSAKVKARLRALGMQLP